MILTFQFGMNTFKQIERREESIKPIDVILALDSIQYFKVDVKLKKNNPNLMKYTLKEKNIVNNQNSKRNMRI
ncbi:unnamed protein product [Paramecium octaurelia]|uniref:Uncharacterized protein n=1 Tax=Paramecium octaurelia TaxID=43137 RepID=A0A8S1V9D5_PAROT|nr:unnamed protein product [Paramecium octaurelia]